MESALIITHTEKSAAHIAELLSAYSVLDIVYTGCVGEARRMLPEREFDYVIINAPLADETGESLARQIAAKGQSQVILIVKSEIYEMVFSVCAPDGVLIVAKPTNRDVLRQAFSLAKSTRARIKQLHVACEGFKQKIDDIRMVDRAKSILISACGMTEQEAHRYIEKKAMDTRTAKRAVSERIVYDYENGTEAQ